MLLLHIKKKKLGKLKNRVTVIFPQNCRDIDRLIFHPLSCRSQSDCTFTFTVLSLGARHKVPLPLKYIFTVYGSPSTYFSWCWWALQLAGLYLSSAKKTFQVLFLWVWLLLPLQHSLLLRIPFTVRVGFLSLLSKSHAVGVFSINCYIQYFITVWRYMSPQTSQGKMKQGIMEINSTLRSQPMSPRSQWHWALLFHTIQNTLRIDFIWGKRIS